MPDPASHLAAFDAALRQALDLMRTLVPQIQAGMSQQDVHQLALRQGKEMGFSSWFRAPVARFDAPPAVRWTDRPRGSKHIEQGTIIELELELAPATDNAFGDVGTAWAFGLDQQPEIVSDARELCCGTVGFASRWKCVGELFVFAEAWATNHRASLAGQRSLGFAAITPDRSLAGRWPGGAWATSLLRRNRVQFFNPRRMNGIYVIRPRMVRYGQGASSAEMVYVTADDRQVIGRDRPDTIATL